MWWNALHEWLLVGAVVAATVGFLVGSYRRGKTDSLMQAEEVATTALTAQAAQIAVQDQTIASLRYELSAVREEMTNKAQRCTEDIATLQAQMTILQTELSTTQAKNVELNQMPPRDTLAALAADASMRITELIAERLHPLEQGLDRLLTDPTIHVVHNPSDTTEGGTA